jgi:hypothetical protein
MSNRTQRLIKAALSIGGELRIGKVGANGRRPEESESLE